MLSLPLFLEYVMAGDDSQLIRMADVVSAVVSLDFSVAAVSSVPLSTFTELSVNDRYFFLSSCKP